MEILIIENLETVRYIIGGLICFLSVVWFITRPKSFQQTLAGEISNKKIKKIKKQVLKLKEENDKAERLLKSLDKATTLSNVDSFDEKNTNEKNDNPENRIVNHKAAILHPFAQQRINEPKIHLGPYDEVKLYIESGLEKEKIHEKTGVPMAEIDLVLKFHRLNKMSQHKNGFGNRVLAYG